MSKPLMDSASRPGWRRVTLGEAITLKRGYDLPHSSRLEGNVPIISSGGPSGFHKEAMAEPPGVVTGRYGTIGEVFFVTENYWPLNTTLYVSDFKGNSEPFVFHLLKCFDFRSFSEKTGVPGVNRNDLHKVKVLLPPLPEQKKIAEILSTWDDALETLDQLIAAKELQKHGLMQQLLTGKKRLPGFQGGWNRKFFGDFLEESRIVGTDGLVAKKLSVKLYGLGVVEKEEKRKGSANTKYYKRRAGQFLYSKLDFLNGAFGIIPGELDGFESTLDLPAFEISDSVSKDWLIQFVSRPTFYKTKIGFAAGGRKARRVNPPQFAKIPILVPTLKEQKAIASVLDTADEEINLLQQKRDAINDQKRGLMQQLLTGKVRVTLEGAAA